MGTLNDIVKDVQDTINDVVEDREEIEEKIEMEEDEVVTEQESEEEEELVEEEEGEEVEVEEEEEITERPNEEVIVEEGANLNGKEETSIKEDIFAWSDFVTPDTMCLLDCHDSVVARYGDEVAT